MSEIVSSHIDSYVYHWETGQLKYLLLKRRKRNIYGHFWQGVAGKIDERETAVETVIRELKEETGLKPIKILVVDHVSSFYQSYNDRLHLVPVFGIEVNTEDVQLSDEHIEFRWMDFETARVHLSWKQQKESLTILNSMLIQEDERVIWSEVKL